MKESTIGAAIRVRNQVESAVYGGLVKPLFFRFDPEAVHDSIGSMGEYMGNHAATRGLASLFFSYSNPALSQELHGIQFANPIGLAAGFDKNARLTHILPHVGFGWMEVGSITARPCAGNPKPRLYRLPKSQSLVINYGLMNDGSQAVSERLKNETFAIPVGTSLAPTNDAGTAEYGEAIKDYLVSYRRFSAIGRYTTLNLSCPNTSNDQPFKDAGHLDELLAAVAEVPTKKPLFLKLSPDLSLAELDALLKVAQNRAVDGVICTNLIKNRTGLDIKDANLPAKGGIGGKLTQERSDQMIAHIAREWPGAFTIVGCGGVSSAEDAYRKIGLGASLIQLVTGMIYQGPQVISQINQGLAGLLVRDGFSSVGQAVGKKL